jgi:xanthine/CO dehydrogenase XdhC/CoxF family maturation factor
VPGGDVLLQRYGRGSPIIDFRLPCGGGLDILLDPRPTGRRWPGRWPRSMRASLPACRWPARGAPAHCCASGPIPPLSLILFGEGAELDATAALARTMGIATTVFSKDQAASKGPNRCVWAGCHPKPCGPIRGRRFSCCFTTMSGSAARLGARYRLSIGAGPARGRRGWRIWRAMGWGRTGWRGSPARSG